MNPDSIAELEQLVSKLLDGQLSDPETTRLEDILAESPEAVARYHELLDNHEALSAIYPGDVYEASLDATDIMDRGAKATLAGRSSPAPRFASSWLIAGAVAILAAVGFAGYYLGRGSGDAPSSTIAEQRAQDGADDEEQAIAGHATLRRVVGVQWSDGAAAYREGDVLPAGRLQFDKGLAEVDFFCGATLIVEGPASMDLESDWSVRLLKGRLRANVPPAARGFVVKAADTDIVDLGTEFALEVGPENARVEVVDGEVKLQGGKHDGSHLVTGQQRLLKGTRIDPNSLRDLSTGVDVERARADAMKARFSEWKDYSQTLRSDDRLILYYPLAETNGKRTISNSASSGADFDGHLVGSVNRTSGRFGPMSTGLEFDRPGARLRTRIDGEFQAFTFACWARIDNLEHRFNALFMADGYENGEPHWQIRHDGRLMFSVMVDETPGSGEGPAPDARLHHIYFTEPFWDISKSGQWFHIVAVYDPARRQVEQYINGQSVSQEKITDKFRVTALRIGAAEIGNWGQPFRKTPGFAVRNLNGAVDELAVFNAALTSEEVHDLYQQGKPLGY